MKSAALHVPVRSCVVCRTPSPKAELIRVARLPSGEAVLDHCHKIQSKGAYLCYTEQHWDEALMRRLLARALRTTLSEQNIKELKKCLVGLSSGVKTVKTKECIG